MGAHADIQKINQRVLSASAVADRLTDSVGQVLVGQQPLLERVLIALFTRGHVLLEGLPGLAKTLLVKRVAGGLDASFSRIQFTPDLLPADVVGTQIYHADSGRFVVKHGPVFANILLADEINRAPAKVQSALLEAMEERQVTIGEESHALPDPFMVLATQNPIEQEGTYPLPEAQMDRFMFKLKVDYPGRDDEVEVLRRMSGAPIKAPGAVADLKAVQEARDTVDEIYVDDAILAYATDVVRATRDPERAGLSDLGGLVAFGASPRAAISLVRAARGHAFLRHRGYVTPEDIKAIGMDVLRHRVLLTYEAEAEEVGVESILERVFGHVEAP
ncbi:MAG: AAA family ATPase [Nitrospirota bacterium]|nr:AAA family ATPase [Nitrospirota bacterium]